MTTRTAVSAKVLLSPRFCVGLMTRRVQLGLHVTSRLVGNPAAADDPSTGVAATNEKGRAAKRGPPLGLDLAFLSCG